MTCLRGALPVVIVALLTSGVAAQQPPPAGQQSPTQQPAPAQNAPPASASTCPAPAPPAKLPERMFSGTTGVLLYPVLNTKVGEFEMFLGYLRDALAKSTDPTIRAQAKGWKIYRDTTPGPNNDIIYVFLLDPAVPCVEYSLGRVISAAINDPAERDRVWNLYKNSVRTGGSLMDLVPAGQSSAKDAAPAPVAPSAQKPPVGQAPAPPPAAPLDANPTKPPR
jgi:hypothetical protein